MDKEIRLMREKYEQELEEMEKLRAEVDKIGIEGRKIRMEWLFATIVATAAATSSTITALKWLG